MKSTTNTLYLFAAAAALALTSCKESKTEDPGTSTDMTTDPVEPTNSNDRDMDMTKDTTAINPDTIMGP